MLPFQQQYCYSNNRLRVSIACRHLSGALNCAVIIIMIIIHIEASSCATLQTLTTMSHRRTLIGQLRTQWSPAVVVAASSAKKWTKNCCAILRRVIWKSRQPDRHSRRLRAIRWPMHGTRTQKSTQSWEQWTSFLRANYSKSQSVQHREEERRQQILSRTGNWSMFLVRNRPSWMARLNPRSNRGELWWESIIVDSPHLLLLQNRCPWNDTTRRTFVNADQL